jgi:putative nucleotidyltransferase with HDIG domain
MREGELSSLSSNRGTNGKGEFIPLLGEIQGRFKRLTQTEEHVRVQIYVGALASLAVGLALALFLAGLRPAAPLWAVLLLAALALAAERQTVFLTANAQISVSVLPILFAATVYGPLEGMAVGMVSLLGDFRSPYARWLTWTATRTLAAGLAGVASLALVPADPSFGKLLGGVAAAAITEAAVDIGFAAMTAWIRGIGSFRTTLRLLCPIIFATVPLYTPVVVLLIYAYRDISELTLVLFAAPAFAAHRFYRLYREERDSRQELDKVNVRLQKANLSFASALVATLDARDRYTAGHSAAVAVYARDIAQRLCLSEEEQRLAHLCGLVHDIGKVGLAPGLLEKPGALTLEERRQMEQHSEIGERILGKVDDYAEIAMIVRHHHERIDGEGYPDGIRGDAIPLISRIIAVADAYNAMTSDRPYRDAMPSRVARLRLAQAVESQFDTNVVAAFEAILAGADEEYRSGLNLTFSSEAGYHESLEVDRIASVA